MAISTINVGAEADDGTGDTLRAAFQKVNDNFAAGALILATPGAQVKLVYRNDRWEYPSDDTAAAVLTDRECSIVWEGTEAQIPSQGTGDADFRVGDTALVRAEAL